jgi:hypothetical protein
MPPGCFAFLTKTKIDKMTMQDVKKKRVINRWIKAVIINWSLRLKTRRIAPVDRQLARVQKIFCPN